MAQSRWLHSKTPVNGTRGMVTARHPLAAAAGLSLLQQGGNAVDAALAAMLATGVVQPFATSIGGGGLLTVATRDGRRYSLDYRSQAPAAATADMYGSVDVTPGLFGWSLPGRANEIGHLATAVPGALPGYLTAQEQLGRAPWASVLGPAIQLAESGFEMDWFGALMQGSYLDQLLRFDISARTFLRDARYPHRPASTAPGDLFRQPQLAATLRELAEGGLDAYLHGAAATALASEMDRNGGVITMADIAAYQPRAADPHTVSLRGHHIIGPAHGGIYALLLGVLDQLDLADLDPLDPQRLHLLAEAIRRCRHIESLHPGDQRTPLWLDHPALAAEVAASIDRTRRIDEWRDAWWAQGPRLPAIGQEGTAHVCAVDSDGMIASLTETVLGAYGSFVTTSAGMLLNNAMFGFVPMPGHANSIRPAHRPHSNMTPLIALDASGKPCAAVGASGGQRISAAAVQVLAYMLDHDLNAQTATNTPRLDVFNDTVLIDATISSEAVTELERRGHDVEPVTEDLTTFHFANPSAVRIDDAGVIHAGVNPLHLTCAAGQ